jgi:hypothetical protein
MKQQSQNQSLEKTQISGGIDQDLKRKEKRRSKGINRELGRTVIKWYYSTKHNFIIFNKESTEEVSGKIMY